MYVEEYKIPIEWSILPAVIASLDLPTNHFFMAIHSDLNTKIKK